MNRALLLAVAATLAASALLPLASAHQNRIPGAVVLNDENPLRPRCYVFSAPIAAGEGPDSVQYFVEANGELAGGVPNGTGPTNTRAATADRTVEGFTSDLDPLPGELPLAETVVGDPSGLQHPEPRFNVASEDPDAAAEDPDQRLTPVGFAETCL